MKPFFVNVIRGMIAFVLALLCNIEYHWKKPHQGGFSAFDFPGPLTGLLICCIIGAVLVYRSFLTIQDILVSRGYLSAHVRTVYDYLPLLLVPPFVIGYGNSGTNAAGVYSSFQWGPEMKVWFYIAILCTIFLFQILCVLREVLRRGNSIAKADNL
jgi:hypothetical protein